jgi:hypothetical protein
MPHSIGRRATQNQAGIINCPVMNGYGFIAIRNSRKKIIGENYE